MKQLAKVILGLVLLMGSIMANESVNKTQDIEIFTVDNKDGKITPETIQAAFEKAGFTVPANRNMN